MQTTEKNRIYTPSSISVHSVTDNRLCIHCGGRHAESDMLPTYPVAGLTYWHCSTCQEQLADHPDIKQAKNIAGAKTTYLGRKGYKALAGEYWVAQNARLKKGVAFVNGDFDRYEFKRIEVEAQKLGLTRWTVLVNGLVKYTGEGFTAIRIEREEAYSFTVQDIQADFMSDVRRPA